MRDNAWSELLSDYVFNDVKKYASELVKYYASRQVRFPDGNSEGTLLKDLLSW